MKHLQNCHSEVVVLLLCSLEGTVHLAVMEVAEQVPTDPELRFQLRTSAVHSDGRPWGRSWQ